MDVCAHFTYSFLGAACIFCVGALKYVSVCLCIVQHVFMGGEPKRVLLW